MLVVVSLIDKFVSAGM